MAVSTGSRHADTSALEALVNAAAGILAADSLSDTLGRIAHHLGVLLDFDEITLYEVDRTAGMLRPVFALGAYADEVMADAFPIGEGVTGWVVANRRTRNVERADHDPIVAVVEGTELEPESLVSVPLIVGDRVVAALNVYRLGVGRAFTDAEVEQVEQFATMAALAFDSARRRETLREQARSDGLTGLLNHRACHERLGEEVARATAADRPLSVVVVDLDHFKTVNDTCGHECGDEVLAAFGVMLRANLRGADIAARAGGEEFVVVLPDTDRSGAMHVAEHLRRATTALAVPRLGARITASFGVATLPDDAVDTDALLRLADRALYAAKQRGRNRVEAASVAAAAPTGTEPPAEALIDATLRASAADAAESAAR